MTQSKSAIKKVIALGVLCVLSGWATSELLATDPPKAPPATSPSTTTAPSAKAKSAEEEAMALKFHQEFLPEIYASIMIIKEKDPNKYNNQYRRPMIDESKRLIDMRDHGSKYYEPTVLERRLDFRSKQLTKELRTPELMPSAEVTQKTQELKQVLSDLFDVRNKIRGYQLDDSAESLERARKELAEKTANKNKELERQFKALGLPPAP